MGLYAHTPRPGSCEWQGLEPHLLAVAHKAAERASRFEAGDLAYMAGLLHDVGKFRPEFQKYLRECHENPLGARRGEVPHSPFGALLCSGELEFLWPVVAGHHSGIYQLDANELEALRSRHKAATQSMPMEADAFLRTHSRHVSFPSRFQSPHLTEPLMRFLFSCLVDADSEDAGKHDGTFEELQYCTLAVCREHFRDAYLCEFPRAFHDIDGIRADVFRQAGDKATCPRGLFKLIAPTGTGKTLATLGFALEHANKHPEIERIIYVAPYTAIIDQTAKVYRKFLPDGAVLEHHSAIEFEDSDRQDRNSTLQREAGERWEAPIIVTTSVQFFESLFSNKRSKTRKLHNIANSVVILDEVQSLPPNLLPPTIDMIRALADGFGCSLVLCTATQPALEASSPLPISLPTCVPLVSDVPRLFGSTKRVDYEISAEPTDVATLAMHLKEHDQVLVVTNTKRLAVDIWKELARNIEDDTELLHLSTLLHPAHRKRVIRCIEHPLRRPVRVISTQLVEAGVDLDFPVVYREFGPLDRIVQAAGRCNRNGTPGCAPYGKVHIFEIAGAGAPPGAYRQAMQAARIKLEGGGDLHDPELYESFFKLFYGSLADTGQARQERRGYYDYPEVAKLYKMIEDDTVPLLIKDEFLATAKGERVFASVEAKGFANTEDWSAIQQYSVSVRLKEVTRMNQNDLVADWIPGLHLWRGNYHQHLGLGETTVMGVEDLITMGGKK